MPELRFSRFFVLAGVLLAAGAAAVVTTGAPGRAQPGASPAGAQAPGAPLRVAMHYVAPPFVGGAKVRTLALPDAELAEALGKALGGVQVQPVALPPAGDLADAGRATIAAAAQDAQKGAGVPAQAPRGAVALLNLPDNAPALVAGTAIVPTGYVSRPMGIMRTDTDITTWRQLAGRTVCVAEGGRYVGWLAKTYGAIEQVKRAPADSLLALRIGECDAAVHDEALLRPLLRLPEWKKFSATLPPGPRSKLVFAVPEEDARALDAARAVAQDWRRQGHIQAGMATRARDIAFEVYLDQEVPDCH